MAITCSRGHLGYGDLAVVGRQFHDLFIMLCDGGYPYARDTASFRQTKTDDYALAHCSDAGCLCVGSVSRGQPQRLGDDGTEPDTDGPDGGLDLAFQLGAKPFGRNWL